MVYPGLQNYQFVFADLCFFFFFLFKHKGTDKVIGFIIFHNLASPPFSSEKQIEGQEY